MMEKPKQKLAIIGVRGIPANYGGFETCAEETAVRLQKTFDVTVFCRKHNVIHDGDTYRGVRLVKLPSLNSKSLDTLSHTFLCALYLICHPSIRIVHLYNAANAVFVPLLRLFGKKVYVSVDGFEWKRMKWGFWAKTYYKFSSWLVTRCANAVVADSRVVKQFYDDNYGIDSAYIPYGANVSENPDLKILEKYNLKPRRYIYFIGRLVPEKGVHNLIKAYNRMTTDMPLVIIGDDDAHKEYVDSLKAQAGPNVRFLGYVYGENYWAINAFCYFYVSASQLEGTSPSLVTAMAAGNCVLVNGIPEQRETVQDAGVVARENDLEDFALKMRELLDDEGKVSRYRDKARRHARATYDWDVIADQYTQLFLNNGVLETQNRVAGPAWR